MKGQDEAAAWKRSSWIVIAIGVLLRFVSLTWMPLLVEEQSFLMDAERFVSTGMLQTTNWYHPVLRNLVLWLTSRPLGLSALAVRLPSALLGSATVIVLYLIARRVLEKESARFLSALFIAGDPLNIFFSRFGFEEATSTFFIVLAVWLYLVHNQDRPTWGLPACGLALGLGAASEWFSIPIAAGLLLAECYRLLREDEGSKSAAAGLAVASLIVLPFAVYLLTYLLWFSRGFRLADWFRLQYSMYGMSRSLDMGMLRGLTGQFDKAWQWFMRPVATGLILPNLGFTISAVSNPFVWLLVLPAAGYAAFHLRDEERPGPRLMLLLLLANYLPMLLTARPIFFYSAMAIAPFAFILVADLVTRLLDGRRWLMTSYISLVTVVNLFFYLTASGFLFRLSFLRPMLMPLRAFIFKIV